MAAAATKPTFEQIMQIMDNIQTLFDTDNVEILEAARKEQINTETIIDIFYRQHNIPQIYTFARSFPPDKKKEILDKHDKILTKFVTYMYKHPEYYPQNARGYAKPAGGGKKSKKTQRKLRRQRKTLRKFTRN